MTFKLFYFFFSIDFHICYKTIIDNVLSWNHSIKWATKTTRRAKKQSRTWKEILEWRSIHRREIETIDATMKLYRQQQQWHNVHIYSKHKQRKQTNKQESKWTSERQKSQLQTFSLHTAQSITPSHAYKMISCFASDAFDIYKCSRFVCVCVCVWCRLVIVAVVVVDVIVLERRCLYCNAG